MARCMLHFNGHLMCAIDVETTGLDPDKHEIHQIAVLPLDSNIQPLKGVIPFHLHMLVTRPEYIDQKAIKNKTDFYQLQARAVEPFTAADMFDSWFDRLKLPLGKKIIPLAQNWPFDRSFILEWLGQASFEHTFFPVFRDTMSLAAMLNDLAAFRAEHCPYSKTRLSYLCYRLDVKNEKPHDALQDAIATAEVYRRMLLMYR